MRLGEDQPGRCAGSSGSPLIKSPVIFNRSTGVETERPRETNIQCRNRVDGHSQPSGSRLAQLAARSLNIRFFVQSVVGNNHWLKSIAARSFAGDVGASPGSYPQVCGAEIVGRYYFTAIRIGRAPMRQSLQSSQPWLRQPSRSTAIDHSR